MSIDNRIIRHESVNEGGCPYMKSLGCGHTQGICPYLGKMSIQGPMSVHQGLCPYQIVQKTGWCT